VTLSDLSIRRPVLASVMSLLVMVAGGVAYFQLPVREYPDVDLPLVSVTTVYPGASPEVVEATITEPLEQTLNGVDQIRSVRSSSSFGISSITVEFSSGRDLDLATNDVTNALQRSLGELPLEAERPVVAKAGANARPIMWLHVKGEGYPAEDLEDIAARIVKTPLQTLPGVANIFIGGRRYAMRIWLDPERMAARGVDARDVRRAVLEGNLQISAGQIEGAARKFTVLGDASLDDPAIYEELILRDDGDRKLRIRDVGTVELGSTSYQTVTRFNGEPIVGVGVVRQSRSNELEVSRAVRAAMPGIREVLPDGVTLDMAVDNTIFVEESLQQVAGTLLLVLVVVVAVNLFFLHSPRATAITSVAIPVALVGTFGAMQALGFSLNVLSLLALLLVIGLLVDDAIVVLGERVPPPGDR
jgi:multidrug efflux pump